MLVLPAFAQVPQQTRQAQPPQQVTNPTGCKTEVSPAQLAMELERDPVAYEALKQSLLNNPPEVTREYVIQLHLVRNDDGTNSSSVPTIAQIRSEFANFVNPYFNTPTLNAVFVECGPEMYHNSTTYNFLSGYTEGANMATTYNTAGIINIYFVENPDGACGWARFPADLPEDYIVIAYSCATNQSTIVHELGHYFDVYHTHETAFGSENVTRNNADACYNAPTTGDLLVDTDADPRLNRSGVSISSTTCAITNMTYADNCTPAVTYTPDPTNIMSYSLKACRTVFTSGQEARMAAAMIGSRSYLNSSGCPAPVANCKTATVQLNAAGTASLNPSQVDNGSTVSFGTPILVVSPNAFTCANLGSNPVVLTVTDVYGKSSTCTTTVVVEDNIAPTALCPSDISVNNDPGLCGATVNFTPNGLDNCSVASVLSVPPSGSFFAVGTTPVTTTVTDQSGNSAQCSFNVTVTDNENPSVFTQNTNVILAGGTASITPADVDNLSTDNCGIASLSVSPSIFSCADIGQNTVTLTITDIYGNVASNTATVDVIGVVPTCSITSVPTSNVFTGGVPTTLYLGYGAQSTILDVTASGGNNLTYSWSGNTSLLSSSNSSNPEFTPTAAGSETFTVTVTNEYGCSTSCDITIEVIDVRCGKNNNKVLVCHNGQSICMSSNAVATHLLNHVGDYLGECSSSNKISFDADKDLNVIASPSPFSSTFTLEIYSASEAPVSITVFDITGKALETYKDIHIHELPSMGQNLASGTYLITIEQGGLVETVKISKRN